MGRMILIGLISLTGALAMASAQYEQGNVERTKIPGEYIMSFQTTQKVQTMSQFAASLNEPALVYTTMEAGQNAKVLLSRQTQNGFKTLVLFKQNKMDSLAWSKLTSNRQLVQMHPNYLYTGEMREGAVDPQIGEQFHHDSMGNHLVWDLLDTTNKIVIAVTDDGVDLDHEDLRDNIFTNPNEIAGNGMDDDNNGYIDDVQGWNFVHNNNDARPASTWDSHGTHVAGIAAATKDNGVGVAGTAAPVALLMPLKFAGSGGGFTSAIVAETYRYAADNGADMITTSYYIDGFVGDKAVEEAMDYVYEKGLIHFNSAGNGSADSPRRKAFEQLILVCNTNSEDSEKNDVKSGSSNYGEGIDVCAPGDGAGGILSTLPGNKYGRMSGTSMASPNAAAVAALIWSQNPDWTREQVIAQLLGTADNIDAVNSKYIGKLGSGRVNSHRALTESLQGPFFEKIKESKDGKLKVGSKELSLRFSYPLDPKTISSQSFILSGPNGDIKLDLARPYKMGSDYVVLTSSALLAGEYTLNIDAQVKDPFGSAVAGNKSLSFVVE